jgi:putative heme iron utilization protein
VADQPEAPRHEAPGEPDPVGRIVVEELRADRAAPRIGVERRAKRPQRPALENEIVVEEEDRAALRELYLARYENAKYWVDYEDFAFYVMDVVDAYFVGGFGVMGWVSAEEYLAAQPDPLADSAGRIISHMNEDHVESMVLLAKRHAGIEAAKAQMTAVDRLGFHLSLTTAEGMKGGRIAFSREVRTAQQAREVLVEMVKEARGA